MLKNPAQVWRGVVFCRQKRLPRTRVREEIATAAGLLDPGILVREEVALDDLPAFFERHLAGGGPPKAAVRP